MCNLQTNQTTNQPMNRPNNRPNLSTYLPNDVPTYLPIYLPIYLPFLRHLALPPPSLHLPLYPTLHKRNRDVVDRDVVD